MEVEQQEVPFEDFPEFKYTLQIKDWKLPLVDLLASGGAAMGDEEEGECETDGGQGVRPQSRDPHPVHKTVERVHGHGHDHGDGKLDDGFLRVSQESLYTFGGRCGGLVG